MSTDTANATENTIELVQTLDLTAAKPLKDALQAARGGAITINAAAVDRIGGQCLQVLLSAAKTWSTEGHGFEITEPSEKFTSGLEIFGLSLPAFNEMEAA